MKVYEGLFIFSVETAAAENMPAEMTSWIQRFEGVVETVTELGTRRLGYKIGKNAEAKVFAVQYQMNPSQKEAFTKFLQIESKLLSFMITFPPSKKPVPKFFKPEEPVGYGYGRDSYGRD